VPESSEGVLPWQHVVGRLERAISYWVSTIRPDGRPHVRPIWGTFLEGTLYLEGSPQTRWARNMAANPEVSVHLESAQDLVIVEGTARQIRADRELGEKLARSVGDKYRAMGYEPGPDSWSGGGLYVVTPRVVYAWSQFPTDATRFRFSTGE
jgi:general stress protein 26